jgi:hypothetical protein
VDERSRYHVALYWLVRISDARAQLEPSVEFARTWFARWISRWRMYPRLDIPASGIDRLMFLRGSSSGGMISGIINGGVTGCVWMMVGAAICCTGTAARRRVFLSLVMMMMTVTAAMVGRMMVMGRCLHQASREQKKSVNLIVHLTYINILTILQDRIFFKITVPHNLHHNVNPKNTTNPWFGMEVTPLALSFNQSIFIFWQKNTLKTNNWKIKNFQSVFLSIKNEFIKEDWWKKLHKIKLNAYVDYWNFLVWLWELFWPESLLLITTPFLFKLYFDGKNCLCQFEKI